MPSTRALEDEVIDSPIPAHVVPRVTAPVKQAEEKAVVSYEQWLENEEDYLLHIYESIQRMNGQSGRRVFERIHAALLCEIALKSFKQEERRIHLQRK